MHGELLNCPKMWRFAMRRYDAMHMIRKGQVHWLAKGDVLGPRAFVHSLFGIAKSRYRFAWPSALLHRHLRQILLDSGSDRDASSANPDQLAWGHRSSARPNIHDDRNGIFRAGPAPWRSSRLRSSHVWVHAFRFLWPVLHSDPTLTLDVIGSRALFLVIRSRPPVLVTRFA